MGVHMVQNNGLPLALFDELSSFLTKLKLCSSKGLSDSHEFYAFLELYNANEWTRSDGIQYCINTIYFMLGEELLSSLSIFIGRAQRARTSELNPNSICMFICIQSTDQSVCMRPHAMHKCSWPCLFHLLRLLCILLVISIYCIVQN